MIQITNNRCTTTLRNDAITVLFGPSGIGKSTLLKQLAGHQELNGSLIFNDTIIEDGKKKIKPENRSFAYLTQRLNLIQTLTVLDNLELAMKFSDSDQPQKLVQQVIAMVEIESLLNRLTTELSGGEYQLVSFCLAIISNSRWLLLDEPFSAVDKARLHRILIRLKHWHREHRIPILYVTHDVHEMALIADDVLHMKDMNSAELTSYDQLVQAVNSDFIAAYANENIIETRWVRTEENIQILRLADDPEQLIWALGEAPENEVQWLSIPLVDISLSRYKLMDSSILNQLEGVIVEIGDERSGICYVSISIGNKIITARITSKSRNDLRLSPGVMCVVCFKAPRLVGE